MVVSFNWGSLMLVDENPSPYAKICRATAKPFID